MNRWFFSAVFCFAFINSNVEMAVARFEVEIGKEARIDFGRDMILIRRTTSMTDESQYLFAGPTQDGTWTTDGKDKIHSNAHLYWNGTIVFKNITKDDIGSYEMPLEPQRTHVARTMIDVVEKGQ